MTIFKQPLLHFLLLGALIFAAYEWRNDTATPNNHNIVSYNSFIEFVQYRHRGIDRLAAEQLIQAMPPAEKSHLLQVHIKEEVLYREALSLGLNDKDYVIKQRLIQKMEYLLADDDLDPQALSTEAVAAYFERNTQRYSTPSTVTFSHVFIDASQHGKDEAQQQATQLKNTLIQTQVPFEQASRHGERFVYFTNYVEREASFIASHFGQTFADTLFNMQASNQWQGPIRSDYGLHIVLLAKQQSGGVPTLNSIYAKVAQDLQQKLLAKQLEANIQTLLNAYNIDANNLENQL